MIKFRDIGTYKNCVNVPYCTVPSAITSGLKNGMGVTADLATKTVALPDATTAKGQVYIVMNRIDKPEVLAPNDYVIAVGENPRLFDITSLKNRILDMDMDAVTTAYASIAVGNTLTLGTDGKWVVNATLTDYKSYLKVTEKTTFGGTGIAVQVIIA